LNIYYECNCDVVPESVLTPLIKCIAGPIYLDLKNS
jgi:hypothetical protein